MTFGFCITAPFRFSPLATSGTLGPAGFSVKSGREVEASRRRVELLPKLFSHLRQETAFFEIAYGAADNELVQVDFLDFGIDPRDQALNDSPHFGIRSHIQIWHLLARHFVRSLNVFFLGQSKILSYNFHHVALVARLLNI